MAASHMMTFTTSAGICTTAQIRLLSGAPLSMIERQLAAGGPRRQTPLRPDPVERRRLDEPFSSESPSAVRIEAMAGRLLSLPRYAHMTDDDVEAVSRAALEAFAGAASTDR
jgi:hypothetical protein